MWNRLRLGTHLVEAQLCGISAKAHFPVSRVPAKNNTKQVNNIVLCMWKFTALNCICRPLCLKLPRLLSAVTKDIVTAPGHQTVVLGSKGEGHESFISILTWMNYFKISKTRYSWCYRQFLHWAAHLIKEYRGLDRVKAKTSKPWSQEHFSAHSMLCRSCRYKLFCLIQG